VIQADLQRYLGPDAVLRQGNGPGDDQVSIHHRLSFSLVITYPEVFLLHEKFPSSSCVMRPWTCCFVFAKN
jgi:hypothetical protein